MKVKIMNGIRWRDIEDNAINCHGGGFLEQDGYIYWFGENRNQDKLVSCYRSKNFLNWQFCNDSVTKKTHPGLNPSNCERPKVVYNEKTKKYVMWLHWENGVNYREARCAVFTSDSVCGDYKYMRSFNPLGHMSRDCTLFKDDDGAVYFISAANENRDLHVYRLTDDYLDIESLEIILWPGASREAPAMFKKGGYYFMITSGCSGWHPNQGKYAYSKSISGGWSELMDFGSPTTYDTQPTFVLPIHGKKESTYLYIADRWDPSFYSNSTYVALPLSFPSETVVEVKWSNSVCLDIESGQVETEVGDSGLFRITSNLRYFVPEGDKIVPGTPIGFARLAYDNNNQLWEIKKGNGTSIRIKHHLSGLYLAPENANAVAGTRIVLVEESNQPSLVWDIINIEGGYVKLQNRGSKMVLTVGKKTAQYLVQTPLCSGSQDTKSDQAILLAKVYE